ncbi:hypothetical protein [Kibdelosporangium phytohabitans]|nr:hypothetical protein [Kibdelosporangium phytohabitans]MBE1464186.1 hypothetical protein [Kibdelosporangium phytohabitans]
MARMVMVAAAWVIRHTPGRRPPKPPTPRPVGLRDSVAADLAASGR